MEKTSVVLCLSISFASLMAAERRARYNGFTSRCDSIAAGDVCYAKRRHMHFKERIVV